MTKYLMYIFKHLAKKQPTNPPQPKPNTTYTHTPLPPPNQTNPKHLEQSNIKAPIQNLNVGLQTPSEFGNLNGDCLSYKENTAL